MKRGWRDGLKKCFIVLMGEERPLDQLEKIVVVVVVYLLHSVYISDVQICTFSEEGFYKI